MAPMFPRATCWSLIRPQPQQTNNITWRRLVYVPSSSAHSRRIGFVQDGQNGDRICISGRLTSGTAQFPCPPQAILLNDANISSTVSKDRGDFVTCSKVIPPECPKYRHHKITITGCHKCYLHITWRSLPPTIGAILTFSPGRLCNYFLQAQSCPATLPKALEDRICPSCTSDRTIWASSAFALCNAGEAPLVA